MTDIIKSTYWSKSEAFLIPLTGLTKGQKYEMKSYLFWDNYTINNNHLILVFNYMNYDDFLLYCKKIIFPTLDKGGYIIESHDFEGKTLFILDISEWSLDIEMFLSGKYSKFSSEAKKKIKAFHTFYNNGPQQETYIKAALEPNIKMSVLGNKTPIEYVCQDDTYGFDLTEMQKIGELASIYNEKEETLTGLTCQDCIELGQV